MVVEELIWVFYEMIYPYSDFNLKFQFIVLSIVVVATLQIFARDLTHLLRETPMSFGFWCVCVYLIYMTTIAFVVPNFGLGLVDSIVLQWRCVNSFQRIVSTSQPNFYFHIDVSAVDSFVGNLCIHFGNIIQNN